MTMYRHVLTNICGVSSYIHILNLLISYSARYALNDTLNAFNHLPQTLKLSPTIRFACFVSIFRGISVFFVEHLVKVFF